MRVHIERQRRRGGAPRGRTARAHVRGGAPMTASPPTPLPPARERLAAQVIDPPERRPAYDVFGPPAAPLPALGGLPHTGAIAAAAALDAGRPPASSSSSRRWRGSRRTSGRRSSRSTPRRALAEARARDAELRAGHRRGPLHGIPVSRQGRHPRRRRADPLRVGRLRRGARGRRRRRRPLARGRRRDPRQDLHARVRARRDEPAGAQPARPDAHPGRVERRQRDRGRHRHGARVARHRHARVDPRPRRAVRRRRAQADLRHRADPRRRAAVAGRWTTSR